MRGDVLTACVGPESAQDAKGGCNSVGANWK